MSFRTKSPRHIKKTLIKARKCPHTATATGGISILSPVGPWAQNPRCYIDKYIGVVNNNRGIMNSFCVPGLRPDFSTNIIPGVSPGWKRYDRLRCSARYGPCSLRRLRRLRSTWASLALATLRLASARAHNAGSDRYGTGRSLRFESYAPLRFLR